MWCDLGNKGVRAAWIIFILCSSTLISSFSFACPNTRVLCRGPSVLFVGENATYQKIQDAINDSKPGDTVYVFNGTYHESLTISKSISLIGESIENTTIMCSFAMDNVINITSNSVNVINFSINNYIGYWPSAGINLFRVQNCNISNNYFSGDFSPGIFLNGSNYNIIGNNYLTYNWDGIVLKNSDSNIISDNYFNDCFLYGIKITNSFKNTFIKNNISGWSFGIDSKHADNNSFLDNIVKSNGGVVFHFSNNNYFENNSFQSGYQFSVKFFSSKYNKMINNTLIEQGLSITGESLEHGYTNEINTSNTLNGRPIYYWVNRTNELVPDNSGQIILVNCTDIKIENQSFNDTFDSISLLFSSRITISNNTFDGSYIDFRNSDNNNILNNIIINNTGRGTNIGLDLTLSSNNSIANNTILNNGNGIYFRKSNYNYIHNNNISSNSVRGMVLYFSNYNIIQNNQISYQFKNGIEFEGSSNNTIVNNMIFKNQGFGIHFDSNNVHPSVNNIIYHNNFIYNYNDLRFQVLDIFNNTWDNGYPAGGNFWSNYEGKDEYNGINQDLPGGDGIGDTPYVINYDSTREDRYPLLKQLNMDIVIPKIKPSTPHSLEVYEGEGFLELSWSPPNYNGGSEITKYNIHRSAYYQKDKVFSIGGDILKFNDTDVSSDDIYFYMISAENEFGDSPNSSWVFGTPMDIPKPSKGSENNGNPISGDVRCMLPLILIFLIVGFFIILLVSRKLSAKHEEIKSDSKDSEKEKQDIEQKSRKT